jgi:hypothetical protein
LPFKDKFTRILLLFINKVTLFFFDCYILIWRSLTAMTLVVALVKAAQVPQKISELGREKL